MATPLEHMIIEASIYEEKWRKCVASLKNLRIQNNHLALENLRLRQHLNRCRRNEEIPNWLERKSFMLNPQSMVTRLQYYVRAGHTLFAIWITDLETFPCISWLFEVT